MSIPRGLVSSSHPVWLSSLLFCTLVLAGVWLFESTVFRWLLLLAAIAHVGAVTSPAPRALRNLVASQSLIVLTTIAAAVGFLLREVGPVGGVLEVLLEFLLVPWTRQGLLRFALHLVGVVGFGAAIALVVAWRRGNSGTGVWLVAPAVYSATAANVAREFAFKRPLRSIGVDPEARDVIFAYGLAVLEWPLLLHAIGLSLLALVSVSKRGA